MMMNIDIVIIEKNDDLVIVNKPAGISVHNNEDSTNLLKQLGLLFSNEKFYPVHRLDKETSGVQVLARNEVCASHLSDLFQKREVIKQYSAILRGQIKNDSGIWNSSLTDKAEGRQNPAGKSSLRVPCETQYEVELRTPFFTLVKINLMTGRMHQIRKHTALINHPIVGDSRYGDPNYNKKMGNIYNCERMFLHCERIVLDGKEFIAKRPLDYSVLLN